MAIADYNTSAALNLLLGTIPVGPGMAREKVNDAIQQFMADLAAFKGTITQVINITDAPFNAVGDGTDAYVKITAALAVLDVKNGGEIVIPMDASGGIFGLSETIQIPENVTVRFTGGVLKILATTTYDAAIIGIPGATNIEIRNPQIDCNSRPGACGIILRRNNPEFRVFGGLIRNCVHDTTRKGGRAINIEAGVDPAAYGSRNAVIMGTIARDCYEALSISGGSASQQESNIRVDMMAENCQSAISLFGNNAGYPHDADEMGCHITMTARNCGKATTYTRAHGVINSDRGCNAKIDIQVMNDATYVVGSLWRGDASNVDLTAQMTGQCSAGLLDFSSYSELNAFPMAVNSTLNSQFNIHHSGTIAETITLPVVTAAYLTNSRFDLKTDIVTSLKPGTANTANKTDCWGRFQNKTSNAIIEGYFSSIGSTVTFADAANSIFQYGGVFDVLTEYRVNGVKVLGAQGAAIASPTGGATVDTEARAAIALILARMRAATPSIAT